MNELLTFFECEIIDIKKTIESETTGKVVFFNLSKDIISKCGGGFWTIEQMMEQAGNRRIKSFIGLSNGSLTTCYAAFDDKENTVEILRPNPNAKDIHHTFPLDVEIEYRKKHWYI